MFEIGEEAISSRGGLSVCVWPPAAAAAASWSRRRYLAKDVKGREDVIDLWDIQIGRTPLFWLVVIGAGNT